MVATTLSYHDSSFSSDHRLQPPLAHVCTVRPPVLGATSSLTSNSAPTPSAIRVRQQCITDKMPLSTRISPAAQRTIRDAFHDLERTVAEKDRAEFAGTTLDNVVKAAHAIEDQLAARQLLRNMRRLTPLFTGLQYYAKSIEVVCNGTPYIAWIWAPIKLILKVCLPWPHESIQSAE